jgi:hypothetical protein
VKWLQAAVAVCQVAKERERKKPMVRRFQQVASPSEKVLDEGVEGEESRRLTSRFEAAHMPFPLAVRLMRDLGAIVSVSFCAVGDFAWDRSHGGRVAS